MPKTVDNKRRVVLPPLIILFSFLLPLLFLFLGIIIFRASNKFAQTLDKEEKILTAKYGDPYIEYRKSVRF
jgi:protein-S-isoprenylcysteine O-methyltransferase Ste14